MNVQLLIAIAKLIEQIGVPAVQQLIAVIHKDNPTQADWEAVFAKAKTPLDQGLNDGVIR